MGSEQNRFPHQERQKRWGGCWGAFYCFGTQRGRKRIVPASRIPEGNALTAQSNGSQAAGVSNQTTTLAPSLLAPPSSPASLTNSALPSTVQSPSCFLSLSANSPGGPSSAMFATGPYAHETQLVSPPVFSAFTTEPSTAPFTPPPELAHLTTPSSPDVPFAKFFTSSMDIQSSANDLQGTYSLYSGSSSYTSGDRLSSSFPDSEFAPQWHPSVSPQNGKYKRSGSARHLGHETTAPSMVSQDTNFFCPDTFAKFYLDSNPPFPHTAGRLSVSKDSEGHSSVVNGHQSKTNKIAKQDVEELEAYRASFGFSADEIITTPHYVEISLEENIEPALLIEGGHSLRANLLNTGNINSDSCIAKSDSYLSSGSLYCDDTKPSRRPGNVTRLEEDVLPQIAPIKLSRKYHLGLSSSDAEIDYRRRNLRE